MADARRFSQRQDDILAANPEVEKATEKMVANHQWMPAGYKVSHPSRYTVAGTSSDRCYRRNSEICLSYRLLLAN